MWNEKTALELYQLRTKNIFQKEINPIANENQLFINVVHADLF